MKRLISLGVVAVVCAVWTVGTGRGQTIGLVKTGSVPGSAQVMVASDHILVVGDGSSLRLVDLIRSDRAVVGRQDFGQPVLGLVLDRDVLYVANSHDGLYRIDVSSPSEPVVTGQLPTRGQAVGVAGTGDHVYAADNSLGFDVVSTAGDLTRVAEYLGDGFPRGIGASGGFVLVADQPVGLVVVDVSGPERPTPLGVLSLGNDPVRQVVVPPAESTEGTATFACLLSRDAGLQIVDLTNPAEPAIVSRLETTGPINGVALWGEMAYVGGDGVVSAWDVGNPAQPSLAFTADVGVPIRQVAASAASLFVATPHEVVIFGRP